VPPRRLLLVEIKRPRLEELIDHIIKRNWELAMSHLHTLATFGNLILLGNKNKETLLCLNLT
jgi:hypothetical protein